MKIYPLKPYLRSDLWGGERLFTYGKTSPETEKEGRISESWELSFTNGGEATLTDGRRLSEVFTKEDFGARAEHFPFFPVLTKFIDAKKNLSVPVHPSDDYALKNEGQFGNARCGISSRQKRAQGSTSALKEKRTRKRCAPPQKTAPWSSFFTSSP